MIGTIRQLARKNLWLRQFVSYYIAPSGLFDSFFKNYKLSPPWVKRINDVLLSSDNQFISRVPNAGKIKHGKQTMHNGIQIYLGSYYGPEFSRLLMASRGVHEPQEERVFMEVLKTLPKDAMMIEMGAFWSFYSLWFKKELPEATNFMIEPDLFNLGQGQRNFKLNGHRGHFVQAFVSSRSQKGDIPAVCVDDFVKDRSIKFVHMLHSDIQGFEYEMLEGANKTFEEQKVGYVFISTHSNSVHDQCAQFLKERNFIIIASANLDQSFLEDGLIVARAPYFKGIDSIEISLRTSM